MTVSIIGGGAAGCFCAIELKRRYPSYKVVVFEAGAKPMAKLSITGGGRCNITNTFRGVNRLSEVYSRGDRLLKKLFYRFNNEDVLAWFANEGVALVEQEGGRVFPKSQDAMQIVRTLDRLMKAEGVEVVCGTKVSAIACKENDPLYYLSLSTTQTPYPTNKVIVTTGGTKQQHLQNLLPPSVELTPTVPSLFTLKIPVQELKDLMGTVVQNVELSIPNTKFRSNGSLLITDWGISGPATLCLSSFSATYLASVQYDCPLRLNWLSDSEEQARQLLGSFVNSGGKKQLSTLRPEGFSDRLWRYILQRADCKQDARWSEIGSKAINRLVNVLTSDIYPIKGRAAFKEEFVTCGGVALSAINSNTLESKLYPGLFFAGEVLDIDAVTGGFNLQAAWTTGFVAAQLAKL